MDDFAVIFVTFRNNMWCSLSSCVFVRLYCFILSILVFVFVSCDGGRVGQYFNTD